MKRQDIIETIEKNFTPGVKFRSLFGVEDVVNENNKYYLNGFDDVFMKGQKEFRLVYSASSDRFSDIFTVEKK